MSGENMDVKLQLKVMVNKERNKVLYAVADNHFADILLSFLTLPMGRVVKVLEKYYGDKAPTFGSLNSLYRSLANLDTSHFVTEGAKKALIDPMSSLEDEYRRLKLDITDSLPAEYFYCTKCFHNRFLSVSLYYDAPSHCHICSSYRKLSKEVVGKRSEAATGDDAFTIHKASFIISDDLQILPSETGFVQIISILGITDADEADAINVDFGLSEIVHLLKASLTSPTPLSDLILNNTVRANSPVLESEPIIADEKIPSSGNFILRAMIQKSTRKFLYAQAEKDFIEFLIGLIYIPVGRVQNLLAGKTCFKAIHNLFRSTSEVIDDKWFKSLGTRNKLVLLNLPHGCISERSILPFNQEPFPASYRRLKTFSSSKFPTGQRRYLEGPQTYKVSDDLTVVPYCFTSTLSSLREQKTPITDVKEVELQIGSKEALSILRAALTSYIHLGSNRRSAFSTIQSTSEERSLSLMTLSMLLSPAPKSSHISGLDITDRRIVVMMNKEKTKVLFAEADSEFTDILLSFLTLPLGRIVKLLDKHYGDDAPAIGSLSRLYHSLATLDTSRFWTEGAKNTLLNPRSSSEDEHRQLKLDVADSPPEVYFYCTKRDHNRFLSVSSYYDELSYCRSCFSHGWMSKVVEATKPNAVSDGGVFTVCATSFIISDDLQIVPNEIGISGIVNVLGITDMDDAEPIKLHFGLTELMKLLKASLTSPTPLSDVVLNRTTQMINPALMPSLHENIVKEEIPNSGRLSLKVTIQKSTGKLLYAQAKKEFVEFLLSLLHIPLGGVEPLIGGKTSFKAIDNLHRSTTDLIDGEYFKTPETRRRLMKPNLAHGCVSKNHILPLTEEPLPNIHYNDLSLFSCSSFPKGQGSYLKGPKTFKVADDLTVTPFCIVSIFSSLTELKIPVSDVEEVEMQIGLKEGLSILKASLSSTSPSIVIFYLFK